MNKNRLDDSFDPEVSAENPTFREQFESVLNRGKDLASAAYDKIAGGMEGVLKGQKKLKEETRGQVGSVVKFREDGTLESVQTGPAANDEDVRENEKAA